MSLKFYNNKLNETPVFLEKYLKVPSLQRLKKVGYFCGMDYASKKVYNFSEYISRYDHSLTVAKLVYLLTKDEKATLAGLFHDIATPCFSHVIDYMNKDFSKQESTEELTKEVIEQDQELLKLLEEDNINVEDVINFKKYSVVDNDRPKICADRLDGIILTAMGWTKNISTEEISLILDSIKLYKNEADEDEIGFTDINVVKRIIEINKIIDIYCHSNEDNYMMSLLGDITKLGIENNLYTYEDLYHMTEDEIFKILNNCNKKEIINLLNEFYNIKKEDIPEKEIPNIKERKISPLLNGLRFTYK